MRVWIRIRNVLFFFFTMNYLENLNFHQSIKCLFIVLMGGSLFRKKFSFFLIQIFPLCNIRSISSLDFLYNTPSVHIQLFLFMKYKNWQLINIYIKVASYLCKYFLNVWSATIRTNQIIYTEYSYYCYSLIINDFQ